MSDKDTTAKKRGVKRTLDAKSYEVKYEAILEVEKGGKSKKQIAEQFKIPTARKQWLD